ncbi:MAG: glutamyl-tRNA reductase, partial [Acidobacteria bacterium]|nr:glutamyl-tRNA reductase [Acidobacteriota bacterium]
MELASAHVVSEEPTLAVIGLNHRSAEVEVRERFWVSEDRRYAALHNLARARGIEEVVVLATCNRTEFILWASDAAAATESVRELLLRDFALDAAQWDSFYRLYDEKALAHVFRVTSSLDSMVVGEPEITGQVKSAWARAQQAGATGRFLDAVFQKALSVAKRVRNETPIGANAVSVPYAAVELARQIFGSLEQRNVLVLGAGKMSELSARYLVANGASSLWVTNRTYEKAVELATLLHGVAVPFEDRWRHLAQADIVLSSTGCPHVILTREDAERMHRERQGRPVFLIDIAVPRDIDPAVREIPGVFLYDIDDLEQVVAHNLEERQTAALAAEEIVAAEAAGFRRKLAAERVVPTIVAVRQRLDEIRR